MWNSYIGANVWKKFYPKSFSFVFSVSFVFDNYKIFNFCKFHCTKKQAFHFFTNNIFKKLPRYVCAHIPSSIFITKVKSSLGCWRKFCEVYFWLGSFMIRRGKSILFRCFWIFWVTFCQVFRKLHSWSNGYNYWSHLKLSLKWFMRILYYNTFSKDYSKL